MTLSYEGQIHVLPYDGAPEITNGYMTATCPHCGYRIVVKEEKP